jgi:DNA-binding transcriptional ArsR family regulator
MQGGVDALFSALADGRRRSLVELLSSRPSATATELARELPVTRQAVSKHLISLGEAGLVTVTRSGREARYELSPQRLADAVAWIERVGGQWDTRLEALAQHLGSVTGDDASGGTLRT